MRILNLVPKILGWLSLVIWLSFIYLFLQYDATRPTVPQPAEGRVYSSNNHGHVVYLTEREEDYLHCLMGVAIGLFVVAALGDYFQRQPQQIGEIRGAVLRMFYGFFSAASWWAFGVAIGRHLTSIGLRLADVFRRPQRWKTNVLGHRTKIRLRTEITISDCETRLAGSIGFNTVGPVLGSINGDKFHLYVVRKDFRNSFSPHFYGKLVARPSGTIIKGYFAMHFFVKIFLSIWFTGVIAVGGRITVLFIKSLLTGRPIIGATYLDLIYPAALFLCGLLIVYWCKLLAQDDEAQILGCLQRILDARPEIYL